MGGIALAFIFIEEAFKRLPAKHVSIRAEEDLHVVYSDAACEPGSPITYGWLVASPGRPVVAGCGIIPDSVQKSFKERSTQIFVGELLAALSAIHDNATVLENGRVLHFVDNQAALSTLIGGLRFCTS